VSAQRGGAGCGGRLAEELGIAGAALAFALTTVSLLLQPVAGRLNLPDHPKDARNDISQPPVESTAWITENSSHRCATPGVGSRAIRAATKPDDSPP
jgi:hypothetical protein